MTRSWRPRAAGEGLGATLTGQPLRPARTSGLEIALVATSNPPFAGTQPPQLYSLRRAGHSSLQPHRVNRHAVAGR